MTKQLLLVSLGLTLGRVTAAESFYKEPPIFSMAPGETKSTQTIDRFGPVGMAVELVQPAFVMKVGKIEEGSPAAATGKLKQGQIIDSINGQKLKEIDPRIQLGRIIEQAEATDGAVRLMVKGAPDAKAEEVVVKIPVLGAYSKTWPLHCPKSDKIVRNFAEYLKKPGTDKGFADIGMLFLLSTGDESDLPTVREWARGLKGDGGSPWAIGYGGLALCEYYLRTGDAEVLPAIQARADNMIGIETFGGWAGRGPLAAVTYGGGGGHLNAGGTAVVTFLMLAKECGAQIPDASLNRILTHFYRFVGRGNNPYGNNKPEGGYTDNGKNGNLAFAMAAAASLTPDGEKSIYADARDVNARFSFYSTSYMLHGHTGGGIGEIWRSAAMGLLYGKSPNQYREFMDHRKWHYELSRRFDGTFGILGGLRYDTTSWGAGYALTYTIPRKTLRISGAPPTKFSKLYQLPERPWGTAADDDFVNPGPAALNEGIVFGISDETLAGNASMAMNKLLGDGNVDFDTMIRFLHHPDYMIRVLASRSLAKFPPESAAKFLASKDARVRRAALDGMLNDDASAKLLNKENFDRVIAMLKDPAESWFVKEAALQVVGKASPDWIAPNVDVLIPYLGHEEWWLQNSALIALTPVVGDKRCYGKVIPAIGQLIRTCPLYNVTAPVRWGALPENLRNADAAAQALARREFKEAYTHYVEFDTRSIPAMEAANQKNLEFIAATLAGVEDGFDVLYQVSKQRFPNDSLPYDKLFLSADPEKFSPELRSMVNKIISLRLIPEYIGSSRRQLLAEAASDASSAKGQPRMDGLVELYQKSGVPDYNWHDFGTAPSSMSWQYITFDPPETKPWDVDGERYRKVTLPAGMENWFDVGFDPGKAGWKSGLQPIGQQDGEPVTGRSGCALDFCRCGEPLQTLWEKEVLLTQGRFKFPAFRQGYRYRLVIGGMSHVGAGEGFRIYANGKQLMERPRGVGKREGAKPVGCPIDKSWWADFQGGEVTLAAISFKNIHKGVSSNHFSVWIQEMKVPPLNEEIIQQSASVLPMRSSEWQAKQDPDNLELQSGDDMFHYDGKFISTPAVFGDWKTVALVPDIDAFHPAKPISANRAPIQTITFKDQGKTNDPFMIWSGDILMNLDRNEALKMVPKTIDGTEYLFIEAGGFAEKNKPDWRSQWSVMRRAGK
jgi:hypothetical protein